MEEVRGKQISLIFQSSKTALNPLMTVGSQIARVFRQRFGLKGRQAWQRAVEMLDSVGIQQPDRRAHQFPHQFSGGMAQRVMIALAIACQPRLLIADEPTTGLDVTTEAQILDLLQELRQAQGSSMLLITHNLGVVAAYCDYVAVMHGGHIVEFGPLRAIFHHPAHPYTRGLLASIPRPDRPTLETALDGRAPDPLSLPAEGCRFIVRCRERMPHCHQLVPRVEVGAEHHVLCHLYGDAHGRAAG
jgi:oligopeptide/dipeptide ABC transporter ATP-binding protein